MPDRLQRADNNGDASPKQLLTSREKSVATSVARGLTNKEIAAEMEISVRTVENHISHILEKTRFSNRVEIARYVFEGRI